jgi:hypothetical protein
MSEEAIKEDDFSFQIQEKSSFWVQRRHGQPESFPVFFSHPVATDAIKIVASKQLLMPRSSHWTVASFHHLQSLDIYCAPDHLESQFSKQSLPYLGFGIPEIGDKVLQSPSLTRHFVSKQQQE